MAEVDDEHNRLSTVGKAGLKSYLINDVMGGVGGGSASSKKKLSSTAGGGGGGGRFGYKSNHNNIDGTGSTTLGGESGHSTLWDKSKPIADLFPETTIMFGDISG